jgi:hypothetical protein
MCVAFYLQEHAKIKLHNLTERRTHYIKVLNSKRDYLLQRGLKFRIMLIGQIKIPLILLKHIFLRKNMLMLCLFMTTEFQAIKLIQFLSLLKYGKLDRFEKLSFIYRIVQICLR